MAQFSVEITRLSGSVLGGNQQLHDERRAWKGFDWDVLERLHARGLIADPVNKAKSVVLTDEGLRQSEELFRALFTRPRS
ncbi:DUF6429 family protein [Paracoccus everestensis]|uniref:DUF6429 family protein n=1 Tax=Paracoccus everestensis TaxID=2903900 RepID=UPI001F18FE06|nr:DUF6429 family protein [Paracoccus everestensis]